MKIYFLGHSEILIEIKNNHNKKIKILNDCWLSNYAFGDFLQRNPIWYSYTNFLKDLDYIYISHPHCDHLDPYTLYPIYQLYKPKILLPENLLWLEKLIKKYIQTEIIILPNNQLQKIDGLNFYGITFSSKYETNEKDVMSLFIWNDDEIIFLEEDIAIPEEEEAYEIIYNKFSRKDFKTRIYISIRNELEGFFLSTDEEDYKQRNLKIQQYIKKRNEEIEWDYYKFIINKNIKNIYKIKNLIKIYIGQGMIYPVEYFDKLLDISCPLSLERLVDIEKRIMKKYNFNVNLYSQEVGSSIEIHNGFIKDKGPFSKEFKYFSTDYKNINFRKEILNAPVFSEKRNTGNQEKLVKQLLERLYIYLNSNPEIPFIKLIKEQYTIGILYGIKYKYNIKYYQLNFRNYGFVEINSAENLNVFEWYWANDIEDYYNGKLDLFSSVLLNLKNFKSFYFWTMMGIPFLNNDIVYNKMNFHFQNAFTNHKVEDFVLPVIKNKIKII